PRLPYTTLFRSDGRHELTKSKPWLPSTIASSPCSVEPGFSAAALFDICAMLNLSFGLHQDIRNGPRSCLVLMIRNFNRSKPMSTMSARSPMHLPVLAVL